MSYWQPPPSAALKLTKTARTSVSYYFPPTRTAFFSCFCRAVQDPRKPKRSEAKLSLHTTVHSDYQKCDRGNYMPLHQLMKVLRIRGRTGVQTPAHLIPVSWGIRA